MKKAKSGFRYFMEIFQQFPQVLFFEKSQNCKDVDIPGYFDVNFQDREDAD